MKRIRKILLMQFCSAAQLAAFILTTVGIVSLIIGILVMPKLELNEPQFYFGLLGLVAFMVASFSAGQLALIQDRLTKK